MDGPEYTISQFSVLKSKLHRKVHRVLTDLHHSPSRQPGGRELALASQTETEHVTTTDDHAYSWMHLTHRTLYAARTTTAEGKASAGWTWPAIGQITWAPFHAKRTNLSRDHLYERLRTAWAQKPTFTTLNNLIPGWFFVSVGAQFVYQSAKRTLKRDNTHLSLDSKNKLNMQGRAAQRREARLNVFFIHEGRRRSPSVSEIGEKTDLPTFQDMAKTN